jgi:multiple sugar transport system permease protein
MKAAVGLALRGLLVAFALAVALAPFVVLFVNSLRPADQFLSGSAGFLPTDPTWENYRVALGAGSATLNYLGNSAIITTATTLLSVSLGALAAYSLARLRLPLRISAIIAAAFLVVRFYPKITVALPYYLLMRQWHLLDTRVAIILAHVSLTVPFVVWLMLGFFEEFPREIERSAMLDGCGPARRFFQIVLPLTTPALASAGILTALLSWNEFLMASAVGPNAARTLPVRMAGFITDKGTQWGDMSAMGTVIVLPMMLFALATQRWLVRGLTAGAVKG